MGERSTAGTSWDKQEELGKRVWANCRNELYSYFPYLDGAFANVDYRASRQTGSAGTDGEAFYYAPAFICGCYLKEPRQVKRLYLHMMLHCLYLHIFRPEAADPRLWDLACDICAESVLDGMGYGELKEELSSTRVAVYGLLDEKASAQTVCHMLAAGELPWGIEVLEGEFARDDHCFWGGQADMRRLKEIKKKWEGILAYTSKQASGSSKRRGSQRGNQVQGVALRQKGKYDYRRFLKQFALPREEMELDTEAFDYIYYDYGMRHYGNMPLIEPLEYREVNKLEELVIAIDTSSSCSLDTVRRFLEETYSILKEKENFFRKMKVFLIQCDCYVQDVALLTCEEDWKKCFAHIKIQGRGGTDFRPVFAYVEKLKKERQLRDLKALIYFTDGDGIYPRRKPDYETAFVFLRKDDKMDMAPGWVKKLIAYGGDHGY